MSLPAAQRPDYLRAQYGDERNLAARAQIYDFGDSAQSWPAWVLAQLGLQPGERVLECGCGPGWLWAANAAALPPNLSLTLTDQSPGMVAQAAAALGARGLGARFGVVDITDLPFPAGCFDVVVANHMLYHVADRPAALREVARVLRPHGRFLAATNGANHLRQLKSLFDLLYPGQPRDRTSTHFSLENGAAQLSAVFEDVERLDFDNTLAITAAEPVLRYLASLGMGEADADGRARAAAVIEAEIERASAFKVETQSGLFRARRALLAGEDM